MLKDEKEKLLKEMIYEKIKMERINYLQEKHEILEYLDLIGLEKFKIETEKEILMRLLEKRSFANMNNIWLLTSTFTQERNNSDEDTFLYLRDVPFDSKNATGRTYSNIENLIVNRLYFKKNKNNNMTVREFEKENIILNPYNDERNIDCLKEIRYDFIKNTIDKSDKEAKELILKKYNKK